MIRETISTMPRLPNRKDWRLRRTRAVGMEPVEGLRQLPSRDSRDFPRPWRLPPSHGSMTSGARE